MIRRLYKVFLKGLGVVVPILATGYLIYWILASLESVFGSVLELLLPEGVYFAGLGLIAGLAAILAAGFLFQAWLFRRLWQLVESGLQRVPFVGSIYGASKDLMDFMDRSADADAQSAVVVTWPDSSYELLGLVTRTEFDDLPEGIGGEDRVAVYLPMSYQIGGYTVFVPRDRVKRIDLSVEQAMRLAMTATITTTKKQHQADET